MGRFFRRNRSPNPTARASWAPALRPDQVSFIVRHVRSALGSAAPDAAAFENPGRELDGLDLRILALRLADYSEDHWPEEIRRHLAEGAAYRAAGDLSEATSQDFAGARSRLRLVPMPPSAVPTGDLALPSLVPDIVEVPALDAGESVRYVSARLAARWGTSGADLIAAADEQIRKLRLDHADRGSVGRPEVRAIFSHEPYSAAFARHLDRFAPDGIGALGTLLAIPSRDGLFYRALRPGPGLRGDLVDLVLLATKTFETAAMPVLVLPIWRRPDGRSRVVRFEFSENGDLLGSWDPAFHGVLTALAPRETLAIPAWATSVTRSEYTLFAGLVSASAGVWPEEVALLDEVLGLGPLLKRCRSIADERWYQTIDDQVMQIDNVAAIVGPALVRNALKAPDRIRGRLGAKLAARDSVDPEVAVRDTPIMGSVEVLGAQVGENLFPVPATIAQQLGPLDRIFEQAERQAAASVTLTGRDGFLSTGHHDISGSSASLAMLKTAEWAPSLLGNGGLIVGCCAPDVARILRVDDAMAVLDLGVFIGLIAGDVVQAKSPIPPSIMWEAFGLRVVIRLEVDGGVLRGGHVEGPLRDIASRVLPPKDPPIGLDDILGRKRWRPFVAALRDEVINRIEANASELIDLQPKNVREFAIVCAAIPEAQWPAVLAGQFEDIAIRRAKLDQLSLIADYEEARPHLTVQVGADVGQVRRILPGGVTLYVCFAHDGRTRPLLSSVLDRWRVDEARCWEDAIANLVSKHEYVEDPIMDGHPSWRTLYAADGEYEAAAAFLDRIHPGSREGFVVSITHGSRAHFVRLDEPGGAASVEGFATFIRGVYGRANDAGDAHSSMLLWLKPDGRMEELFDVLESVPELDRLPGDFAALVRSSTPA